MKAAHAFQLAPSVEAPAHQAPEGEVFARAERTFGAPAHLVLASDAGPALSVTGWVLGTARVEVAEGSGESRTVVIEILFTKSGMYAIAERVTRQAANQKSLHATLSEFAEPRDVYRYCESSMGTMDPARDAVLAAALDHAARAWSPLRRPGRLRISSGAIVLPFLL